MTLGTFECTPQIPSRLAHKWRHFFGLRKKLKKHICLMLLKIISFKTEIPVVLHVSHKLNGQHSNRVPNYTLSFMFPWLTAQKYVEYRLNEGCLLTARGNSSCGTEDNQEVGKDISSCDKVPISELNWEKKVLAIR